MGRRCPPSFWPHPRPAPAPRPPRARPGEKALIGKIAQEPAGGGGAVSSSGWAAWRRRHPPPPMSSPPGEVRLGVGVLASRSRGVYGAHILAQQEKPLPPGSRPQSRPPAFAPSLSWPGKLDSALWSGGGWGWGTSNRPLQVFIELLPPVRPQWGRDPSPVKSKHPGCHRFGPCWVPGLAWEPAAERY